MESYIQQGDCLLLMENIPDGSIDMILCDLPYGVTQNPYDKPIPFERLWANYKRIIKPNGVIALFGQGQFFIDLVASNRAWYRYDIVWDKVLTTGFLNAKRMPLRRHEQVAIFYQKLPTYRDIGFVCVGAVVLANRNLEVNKGHQYPSFQSNILPLSVAN